MSPLIKRLRKNGWSVSAIANHLGVSAPSVYGWERLSIPAKYSDQIAAMVRMNAPKKTPARKKGSPAKAPITNKSKPTKAESKAILSALHTAGWSQLKIGKALKVSPTSVNYWYKKGSAPSKRVASLQALLTETIPAGKPPGRPVGSFARRTPPVVKPSLEGLSSAELLKTLGLDVAVRAIVQEELNRALPAAIGNILDGMQVQLGYQGP